MQVAQIVHQLLDATIHKTRIKSLLPIIQAILISKQLRLTQLGRSLETSESKFYSKKSWQSTIGTRQLIENKLLYL